jgi:dTDP-4-amino-4,6-dideoxygalactose transaminase
MRVQYNYLNLEFKNTNSIFKEWKKLIKTTDFTLGAKMVEFEKKFSKYIGSKYCVSTNNGTDALILCLKSLGVKHGDEIITVRRNGVRLVPSLTRGKYMRDASL